MDAKKLRGKILKGAVDTAKKLGGFVAGFISALVALMLSKFGCAILVIAFVVLMVVAILVVKARRLSPGGKTIIMIVSTIVIAVGAYLLCNHFHNLHKVEAVEEAPVVETVEETTEIPEVEETTEVTEEEKTEKVSFERNYLDPEERKDCINLENERDNLSEVTTEVKMNSEDDLKHTHEDKNPDKEIIEEAKNDDNKEVTDLGENITSVTEKEEKTEEKEDSKEVKPVEKIEISEDTNELTSEESKDVVTDDKKDATEENVEEKEEDFKDSSDEELEDLFNQTTTTIVTEEVVEVETETTIEEVEVEIEDSTDVEIKIENIEKNEEISNDEIIIEDVETEKEEEKAPEAEDKNEVVEDAPVVEEVVEKEIAVTAIDGYETIIGSSVQFKIDGDNAVIEGLDGIDYTFSNGILTIEVGNEATIISVCVSNSVNSVDFNVVVNGIVQ